MQWHFGKSQYDSFPNSAPVHLLLAISLSTKSVYKKQSAAKGVLSVVYEMYSSTKTLSEVIFYVFYSGQEYTKMQGVNIIVEMLSNVNLAADLHLLSQAGRVMVRIFCPLGLHVELCNLTVRT